MIESITSDQIIKLLSNIIAIIIVSRLIYYPKPRNKDFLFTFVLFNIVIFFICSLLSNSNVELGFAFGLFAVFSILRYRTVTIPVREMGYFFLSVALGIINALIDTSSGYMLLLFINFILILTIILLDQNINLKHENVKLITLDTIDSIKEEQREQLLQHLYDKTGIKFHRVEILKIDFFRETARINAYFYSSKVESNLYGSNED
jgi:hypothetical protein